MKLQLEDWLHHALCKGLKVETIKKELCWECPVQFECLWMALKKDDRISDHPMFMRGGLTAGKREEIWFFKNRDLKDSFDMCVVEIARSRHASERKQKASRIG